MKVTSVYPPYFYQTNNILLYSDLAHSLIHEFCLLLKVFHIPMVVTLDGSLIIFINALFYIVIIVIVFVNIVFNPVSNLTYPSWKNSSYARLTTAGH